MTVKKPASSVPVQSNNERCPNCGYCPHCGRANVAPYNPWYPWYPYTWPIYVSVGGTSPTVTTGYQTTTIAPNTSAGTGLTVSY